MYFCKVANDIPLWPFDRTFILSASNIRVLSGDKGGPTPFKNTHVYSYTVYQNIKGFPWVFFQSALTSWLITYYAMGIYNFP